MNGWGSCCIACSHIATNLGSHRAQMNMGFVYRCRFIIMQYKAYMVIVSTSQLYIDMYNCLTLFMHMLFANMAEVPFM